MIRYAGVLVALMLSLLLGIHASIDKKSISATAKDLSGIWPIKSPGSVAKAYTPVIPRGLTGGRVPAPPQTRHLKGSGFLERNPAINAGINPIAFYRGKSLTLDFREPKALERV